MNLSIKDVRRLSLFNQGLLRAQQFGRGIEAVEKTIQKIHYLQIDTISVVERAHHHVLRARVSDYEPAMLTSLMTEHRSVFEYWFHAAAFLPIADYRFSLPMMQGYAKKRSINKKLSREIIDRINAEGPLQSRDFKSPPGHRSTGWGGWKPTKIAMEHLFLSGQLMISERRGFQKVYDLTENVLPAWVNTAMPSEGERGRYYVRRMLAAMGAAQRKEIAYPKSTVKRFSDFNIQPCIDGAVNELLEEGELKNFKLGDVEYYCLAQQLESCPQTLGRKRIHFLSPFDNLLINRRRLVDIFNFHYQLECYIPAGRRKYGYFTLPILYGDNFIGRMDCKADRKKSCLLIRQLWLEENVQLQGALLIAFVNALENYSKGLNCLAISIKDSRLNKLIKNLIYKG